MNHLAERQKRVFSYMKEAGVSLAVIEDFEDLRDASLRWLTGHPMDALLFYALIGDGEDDVILVPWDAILAEKCAYYSEMIPFTSFGRDKLSCIEKMVERLALPSGAKIELPARITHADYEKLTKKLPNYTLTAPSEGLGAHIAEWRAVKDAGEIAIYRKLSALTDEAIRGIEDGVKAGEIKTELDAALFVQKVSRQNNCAGTGFETLCAGPDRSFGIHCFPSSTDGAFATRGLSILDFGIVLEGYTSDVTLTFARAPLSAKQEEMLRLIEEAARLAIEAIKPGVVVKSVADIVADFFKKAGYFMPHGLGHSVGLEAHEAPRLSVQTDAKWVFKPGMIVTVEPGLYDDKEGGCRLENDVLVTETGHEVLTKSKIIRLK